MHWRSSKRQRGFRNAALIAGTLLPAWLIIGGCSGVFHASARSAAADTLASLATAAARHPDPALVEAGLPAYLLLIDSLLLDDADNAELHLAAARMYTTYAQAFFPPNGTRGVLLASRGWEYALRAVALRSGLPHLPVDLAALESLLERMTHDDAPYLRALSTAWITRIVAGGDSLETLAELPNALAVAERALALDEAAEGGAVHLIFAVYYAARPAGAGQDLERSRRHFERVFELSTGARLLPRVLYAEHWARATLDAELFAGTLERVLAADLDAAPEHRLENTLAQERARALLALREEFF